MTDLKGKSKELYKKFIKNDRVTLSKIISLVENEDEEILPMLQEICKKAGKSYRIGITGPPGAGKSTLVNSLSMKLKEIGKKVGIIAIDPTSPFSGGALLGDRIRMSQALASSGIFMRSMASRGGTGGLARTTPQVTDLLDAFGFDVVIVETVGVGQLELDIAGTVDTTIVVLVPETGGNVQAMKAGLIEIADIFAINKSERQGADMLRQELLDAMDLIPAKLRSGWKIPIVKTVALEDKGIDDLIEEVENHRNYLTQNDLLLKKRIAQKKNKIIGIIKYRIEKLLWKNKILEPILDNLAKMCVDGKIDPYTAAEIFISKTEAAADMKLELK